MLVKKAFLVLSLGFLGAIVGCGGEPKLDVAPVKGTVTLDGSPASNISLSFVPQEGVKGRGGYALTDAEGRFEAKANPDADGIVPGKYRVLFSKVVMPDGSPIPPDTMAADVGAENVLHPIYSDPTESPVSVTVSESGEQDLSLEIHSRPRG